jgi:tetratricopeptide (TPR) repeat protein
LGEKKDATAYLQKAAAAGPDYCFPNKLEDILVLQYAIQANPADAMAPYYLGNLWYDKRQYDQAIACWELAAKRSSTFPTVFRNLGIAAFNKQHNTKKALTYFEKVFQLNPNDARVLMELDQLYKRLNHAPEARLKFLQQHSEVGNQRDDIYLEKAALLNFNGKFDEAFAALKGRNFHPWEGGEGKVSGQYLYGLTELAKLDIAKQHFNDAIEKLTKAQTYPNNLGEGKLPGAQENDIFYWLGCAYDGLGDKGNAIKYWQMATEGLAEPSAAIFYNDQQPDKIFYQGLAWQKVGRTTEANAIFKRLVEYGKQHQHDNISLDYFAVSLPDLLIFEDDMDKRNFIHCNFMAGLGYLGLNQLDKAEKAFRIVLKNDAMHFGAQTHLRMMQVSR